MNLGRTQEPAVERLLWFRHFPDCTVRLYRDIHKKHRIVGFKNKADLMGSCGIWLDRNGFILETMGDALQVQSLKVLLMMEKIPVRSWDD